MNDKKRRERRTFLNIENDIMEATKQLVEEKGVANLTLRGVAKKAGIEPSVFYNRYKDLSALIDKFAEKYDYWFTEDIAGNFGGVEPDQYEEFYKSVMRKLITGFYKNKSMQKLIAWTLTDNNPVIQRTCQMREKNTDTIVNIIERHFIDRNIDINIRAASSLIVGGIYFQILYKEQSTFCRIDFNSPEGEKLLIETIEKLVSRIFTEETANERTLKIAKKMKSKGIDNDVIQECTDLPLSVILEL